VPRKTNGISWRMKNVKRFSLFARTLRFARSLRPSLSVPSACIDCISQVLLAKIEALESGKEGSGYEVQKKIEE
jgi:hypothetical protein